MSLTCIAGCRVCEGTALEEILAFGELPLANALPTPAEAEAVSADPRYPLTVVFCPDCGLLQLRETVAPDVLFRDYLYHSSFSDAMVAHAHAAASQLIERRSLDRESLVVEVASNDGYLLQWFAAEGIPVLGIEPATEIAAAAEAKGIPTVADFFSAALAEELRADGTQADVVLGNNVLAHVADLNGFVSGVATMLKPGGCGVFEFPYVVDLVDHTEFDTMYHEHLCYFSLHAVRTLMAQHDLVTTDVERLPIHGGSLRLTVEPSATASAPSPAVGSLLAEEVGRGVPGRQFYSDFGDRVRTLCDALKAELGRRKGAGERLAAYGASAKGSTLMGVCGIGAETLDFVVDRSTVKQGRLTPGNRLPIGDPALLCERRPDAVLLLTWNFAGEILQQQAEYLRQGGTFIIPVPMVRAVGAEALECPTS